MSNVLIHKANKLKPQTRAAVESELGRSLKDDEDVSIMAFSTHEAPTGEARRKAAESLKAHLKKVAGRNGKALRKETEGALNEALKAARPSYRERE